MVTAEEYLSRVRTLEMEIEAKLEQIDRLRALLSGRSQRVRDMPRGGQAHDWTDTVAKVMELEQELDAHIDRLVDLKREIAAAIAAVADGQCRVLLEYRYLCGWEWQRIAEAMHFDRVTVWRLHGRALQKIVVPGTGCNTVQQPTVL